MDTRLLTELIVVIRAEKQRRAALLKEKDPHVADDHWLFQDWPFINDLSLTALVTLWHQVERALINRAARAADQGKLIDSRRYHENVDQLQERTGRDWKKISVRLKLESCDQYASMQALRLLVNSYKHDHWGEPSKELKKYLDLPTVNYAPLPESSLCLEKIAAFIGLGAEADYCDVAERFLEIASAFLKDVDSRGVLSKIKLELISIRPHDMGH